MRTPIAFVVVFSIAGCGSEARCPGREEAARLVAASETDGRGEHVALVKALGDVIDDEKAVNAIAVAGPMNAIDFARERGIVTAADIRRGVMKTAKEHGVSDAIAAAAYDQNQSAFEREAMRLVSSFDFGKRSIEQLATCAK